ncbi:hypothetical protein EON64_19875 [archaeon]|nr:MAG: hypothetical protein EON64_19875 [archaeon]
MLTSPKRTRGGAAAAGAAAAALPVASRGKQVFAALPLRPAAWRVDGTRQLITQLHLIQELSATLHTGARPSDEIACSAWLDAVGTQRYVQSAPPSMSRSFALPPLRQPKAK